MKEVKMAKLVVRSPHLSCGVKAFSNARLKALAQDEEHKPYVRAKQNAAHLPDAWDDTKWIRRMKSWKYRCRKKHQWMPHWMTFSEWNWLRDVSGYWWSESGGMMSNSKAEAPVPKD
jgi:hypothetical protein